MPPSSCNIPSIVTVHDLTHLRFYSKMHAAYYNWVLRTLYRKATRVVCVSEYTRTEFLGWSGVPADKVVTIHNGVSPLFGFGTSNSAFSFPYVFYPGNHRAYKNTDRLIRAFAASRLPTNGIHLVFTGERKDSLQVCGEELGVAERIHFVGDVTEQRLIELYRGALLVAFVSLYEGFGLPILEAMTAGVPVLTSNTSAMPETAGNAALVVDPYSVDEIANGLNLLAFDKSERDLRIRLGNARSMEFSWDASASRLSALIKLISRDDAH
jgi:glycosyltransferase involved in cell wall biosynthesis